MARAEMSAVCPDCGNPVSAESAVRDLVLIRSHWIEGEGQCEGTGWWPASGVAATPVPPMTRKKPKP